MRFSSARLLGLIVITFWAAGCAANYSFPIAVRPGDTILLSAGWSPGLTRQNVSVTITPSDGRAITYGPDDPNVRAVVNFYPDPVSRLVVGTETAQGLGYDADVYGASIDEEVTNHDPDWYNTMVYLRLPDTLPSGKATIEIAGPKGRVSSQPAVAEILPAASPPNDPLDSREMLNLLRSLERADHSTVTFAGEATPHSIQLEIAYVPGAGRAWVVNPRGDLKNLSWTDTGSTLRVMLTPANGQTPEHIALFKFYIAGNITGLQTIHLRAYDVAGNLIPDIRAVIR